MINQRYCPFCRTPAAKACEHLALAAEGRDFVRRCVELCHGEDLWRRVCEGQQPGPSVGGWSPKARDYTWLESAFCDEFLRKLPAFGEMEHEWRSGPKPEQGGFWVLLWSKEPQQLWWELREAIERRTCEEPVPQDTPPWLIFLNPK
jgi:hypothetical protein